MLESIVALLPRAAAELMLAFADAGESDFVQVTRAAVDALGEDDAASDIAHAIDARIRHLLIDEFQDTSITQFELIERLIADWRTGDGRTVFVVGDPMQSIYRFREAEVGLFLRAWNIGVASVAVAALAADAQFPVSTAAGRMGEFRVRSRAAERERHRKRKRRVRAVGCRSGIRCIAA